MMVSAKKEIHCHYLYFTTWDVSSSAPLFPLCTHPFKNVVSTLWRTCLLYKTWTQMYNGEHKTWWMHKSFMPARGQSVRPLRRCASDSVWNVSELCCRGDVCLQESKELGEQLCASQQRLQSLLRELEETQHHCEALARELDATKQHIKEKVEAKHNFLRM